MVDTSGDVSMRVSVEAEVYMGMGMVLSACVAASKLSAPIGVQHITVELVEAKIYAGMGMVPSACVAAGVQHGTVMVEMDGVAGSETEWGVEVEVEAVVVGIHGNWYSSCRHKCQNSNTATSAGLVVGCMEGKTGPCAAFDVSVAGQDMNTTQGVSSNSAVGTGVCLTPQAGVGVQIKLWVTGGMQASCSQG